MSCVTQTKCDGCGKIKQESNHWWRVGVGPAAVIIALDDTAQFWEHYMVLDYCGAECALRFVSSKMGKVTPA